MADIMGFPNTMEEFIDSFSFKDSEEIYTNGAELVSVFRVKQGFEHYTKEIRVRAIDDFVKYIDECSGWTQNCIEHNIGLTVYTLHQIAEKLKAGVKNE